MPVGMFSGEAMNTPSDSETPGTLHQAAISTIERDSTVHHDVRRRRFRLASPNIYENAALVNS
jgi:hypothetical protein